MSAKLPLRRTPRAPGKVTAESKYWHTFRLRTIERTIGAPSYVEFCSSSPHDFAITASTRVLIFGGGSGKEEKTLSRFKDVAYSGSFRHDGQLLAAGCETGVVQLFDVNSRSVLRQFKHGDKPVKVVRVLRDNRVLSGGNDAAVKLWDIATGEQLATFTGHTDYVRSAAVCQSAPHIFVTAAYDHSVRVWDARADAREPVRVFDLQAPVECVSLWANDRMLSASAEASAYVFDLGTGRTVASLANHSKTVTSVFVDGSGQRMLTAGLDHLVKVYDVTSWRVIHSMRYPAPILSAAISPDDSFLVVAQADSTVNVRLRKASNAKKTLASGTRRRSYFAPGTFRFFMRGLGHQPSAGDHVVEHRRKQHLKPYEEFLRAFRYRDALDAALGTGNPVIVSSMLHELLLRGELRTALSSRDEERLEPVLRFVLRYVAHPAYSAIVWEVCNHVLALYGSAIGHSPLIDTRLVQLRHRVRAELHLQQQLLGLQGMVEALLVNAQAVLGGAASAAADVAA